MLLCVSAYYVEGICAGRWRRCYSMRKINRRECTKQHRGPGTTLAIGATESAQQADRRRLPGTQLSNFAGRPGHPHTQSSAHGRAAHAGYADHITGAGVRTSPGPAVAVPSRQHPETESNRLKSVAYLQRPDTNPSGRCVPAAHYDIDFSRIVPKRVAHLQVQLLPRIDAQLSVLEAIVDDNPKRTIRGGVVVECP